MTTNNKMNSSSLGTGSFSKPGTPGGPAFCMTSTKWITLQTFLETLSKLPCSTEALRGLMGSGAPSDMSDFTKLVTLYSQMYDIGSDFKKNTYPLIVGLATSIYDYNSKISTCYNGLNEIVTAINNLPMGQNPSKEQLNELKETFTYLGSGISKYVKNATTVITDLQNFINNLNKFSPTLSDYLTYYKNEYGEQSAAVKALQTELSLNISELGTYQEEYKHDVTVAATTPTYAWIFPVGTVAGAIVAGTFGAKATAALNNFNATKAKIDSLNKEEKADSQLMSNLHLVDSQLSTIQGELDSALTILEGVEGNWTAISGDIQNIYNELENGDKVPSFLLKANYQTLINNWSTLAGLCDAFRQNAYITTS